MAKGQIPCPTLLRQLLDYEPTTGRLFWKDRPLWLFERQSDRPQRAASMWKTRSAGKEALTATGSHGYRCGPVLSNLLLAHRVIWALQTGEWPQQHIDHINGDKQDNRWGNLRCVSQRSNMRNRKLSSNNSSGCHGVSRVSKGEGWRARIHTAAGEKLLGVYDDRNDAIAARKAAEKLYGYHENHGRS